MCKFNQYCSRCEIGDKKEPGMCADYCVKNPGEAERIVSEWAKEHPIVTNADKVEEIFGNAISQLYRSKVTEEIDIAIKEWLEQEYKPPRKENADES